MPSDKRARQRAARYEKRAAQSRVRKRRRYTRRSLSILVIAAAIVLVVVLVSTGSHPKKAAAPTTSTTTTTTFPTPTTQPLTKTAVAPACPTADETKRIVLFTKAPPDCIGTMSVWNAVFETSLGDFTVQMKAASSYNGVNNFVFLARWNYYNGTYFNRIVTSFVDQAGELTGDEDQSEYPGYSFTGNTPSAACAKAKSCYPAGSFALANSEGKLSTDSSQFFITVGSGGSELSDDYTLLGHVTEGMSVVNKINKYGSAASVDDGAGTPTETLYLTKVTVTQVKS